MTQETSIRLSESLNRMCGEYDRIQDERLYGRDEQSARNPGVFRSGEALRQVVRMNTRNFVGIARTLVDELAADSTYPQAYLTVHERISDVSANYIVRLWAGRPVIDGQTGQPVSSLRPTGLRRSRSHFYGVNDTTVEDANNRNSPHLFIQEFDTRVADLTLASNECCEEEQRDLVSLLNERGVVVGQREPVTISLGFYEVIVDFYRLNHNPR